MTDDTSSDDKGAYGEEASSDGKATPESKDHSSLSQVRGELKDQLGKWLHLQFYGLILAGAVAAYFGITAIVRDQVTDLVRRELERTKENINEMRNQASEATMEAVRAADRAIARVELADEEIANMRKRMAAAIEDVDRAAKDASMAAITAREEVAVAVAEAARASQEAERASQIARAAAAQSREVLATAGKIQGQFEAERAPQLMSENDRRALRIRQTVERLPELASGQKTWRLVTFSLEIDAETADSAESELLARVERVDYIFDERWFAEPIKSVTSAASRFSHSIRVFGATTVRAVIYLKDPPTTVEREGVMKLFATEPQLLE